MREDEFDAIIRSIRSKLPHCGYETKHLAPHITHLDPVVFAVWVSCVHCSKETPEDPLAMFYRVGLAAINEIQELG